jgi:hypothetical protein
MFSRKTTEIATDDVMETQLQNEMDFNDFPGA